jgi:ATP-dependent RNA circularization protein (DNA/RNA ligase family)
MEMKEYHKIQSLYKRDKKGKFEFNNFSRPEFEYLFKNRWVGTEKIDGTNIRIGIEIINDDGFFETEIRGRTDKADIPKHLKHRLDEIISNWIMPHKTFDAKAGTKIILFGEGYGNKIQKIGKKYLTDSVDFILFDVQINNWILKREDVVDIADKLGIKVVPVLFEGTLEDAVTEVSEGFNSVIGVCPAEGLVLTPKTPLFNRKGERVITKLKTKDFR